MSGKGRTETGQRAAWLLAALAVLFVPSTWALGQHGGAPSRPAPMRGAAGSARTPQPARPPGRANSAATRHGNQGTASRAPYTGPGAVAPSYAPRPAYPATPYPGRGYPATGYAGANSLRPAYNSHYSPPGHLNDWLNQHRNVPLPQQEQMLRSDPSFKTLAPNEQQQVVRQLSRVNQMPEAQRERRLARAEALERMSSQERAQVHAAGQRWASQPADRQAVMRSAFRDLRNVPEDQRATVLNSDRYKGVFSDEERGIMTEMLKAEPYQPPR